MFFSPTNISNFFAVILAGESKTYDDHNWYNSGGLRGYIKGQHQYYYPLLKKDLSKYTVKEVMEFQSRSRDQYGQLWATGRYQIIPNTLKGLVNKGVVSPNDKYNKTTQDKLGMALIKERSRIWNYLNGTVPDTKQNLELASLEMAKIWASIGVPYDMQGSRRWVLKNQSYYYGGGDKAHVSTESVQKALKAFRKTYGIVEDVKKNALKIVISLIVLAGLTVGAIYVFRSIKKK